MKRINKYLFSIFSVFQFLSAPAAQAQSWSGASSMQSPRYAHAAALLPIPNGRVLVVGGYGAGGNVTAAAEIFDPGAGGWAAATPMSQARAWATASLLPDGRVIVAGGAGPAGAYLTSAEIFDFRTGQWTAAASMAVGRYRHTATVMFDGKVLVAGGYSNGASTRSVEIYRPDANAWAAAPDLTVARQYHAATLLPNGKVLLSGGHVSGTSYLTVCSLFDPDTGAWVNAAPLAHGRCAHTATLLPDGTVLAAGGAGAPDGTPLDTAESYDPSINQWSAASPMPASRYYHTATLLPNGKLLVAGGISSGAGQPLSTAELYDYQAGTWAATGGMVTARKYHVATLLPDGRVLASGGFGVEILQSAEWYVPEAGFDEAAKPIVEEVPPAVLSGDLITIRGRKLCGASEASGGNFSANSPSNVPFVWLRRVSDGGRYGCQVNSWKPDGKEASCAVPVALSYGSYEIIVIVNAVPSDPVPIESGYPFGHACTGASECQTGPCVEGVCCNEDCTAQCFSCDVEGGAGTCLPLPYGIDPYGECGGGDACGGFCDGGGGCAYPGQDVSCGNCLACDGAGGCGKAAAGAACDDQQACTVDDRCDEGGDCAGVAMACETPPDERCFEPIGACAGGECVYAAKGFGTSCDDADACTLNDACDGAGACAGTARTCAEPGAACYEETGVCIDGDCVYAPKAQGAGCDDADACTIWDRCDGEGACAGTEVVCATSVDEVCFEPLGACEAGECIYYPKVQGEPCDDADPCTGNDACDGNGSCAGEAVRCDAPPDTLCHEARGRCESGRCIHDAKVAGAQCDDADPCTLLDVCNAEGVCAGTPVQCAEPPNVSCYEQKGYCFDGLCRYNMLEAGARCDDGDECTGNDECDFNGNCTGELLDRCKGLDAGAADAAHRTDASRAGSGENSISGCSCGVTGAGGGRFEFLLFSAALLILFYFRRARGTRVPAKSPGPGFGPRASGFRSNKTRSFLRSEVRSLKSAEDFVRRPGRGTPRAIFFHPTSVE